MVDHLPFRPAVIAAISVASSISTCAGIMIPDIDVSIGSRGYAGNFNVNFSATIGRVVIGFKSYNFKCKLVVSSFVG